MMMMMMSPIVSDVLAVCRRVRQRGLAYGTGGGGRGGGDEVQREDGASAM